MIRYNCPKCNTDDTYQVRHFLIYLLAVIFFPIGLLLLLLPSAWRCHKCQYTWYPY